MIKFPEHMNNIAASEVFDGYKNYTGESNLRIHQSDKDGDNVMIIKLSRPLPVGSTLTYYFENDDCNGATVSSFVDNLKTYLSSRNYSISSFDTNNDGVLNNTDFDKNGDGKVTIASGVDYSPLGVTIQLYLGNPGYPAGTGNGTVVQTEFSPVRLIKSTVYNHTVTAVSSFNYIVFESNPDGSGDDPRLIEVELNGNQNPKLTTSQITSGSFNLTLTC